MPAAIYTAQMLTLRLTVAAVFIASLARTWRQVRRVGDEFGRGLSNRFAFLCGAAAGLLALALHSAVDFNLHVPANALVGSTLLALLTCHVRFATDRYWFTARLPARLLVSLALAGGVTYLGSQEWRRAHEAYWQEVASHFPVYFSPQHTAALEKAFAAEPMNFETAYDIGEAARADSFNGGDNYQAQAAEAMQWLARAQKLDPYDPYSFSRYGMCLDWLDRHDEADKYFSRAEALDPNGYYTVALVGWHYVQIGDYAAALPWFDRSDQLEVHENDIAAAYHDLCWQRLVTQATGQKSPGSGF